MTKKKEIVEQEIAEEISVVAGIPLYTESHPILGITRRAVQPTQAAGDGRIGDPAQPVVTDA